jgi:hypothetical protein
MTSRKVEVIMAAKNKESALSDWLAEHDLNPSTFGPEAWQMIHDNLATLKEIAGLTLNEIACKMYGEDVRARSRGTMRVAMSRAIISHDIERIEGIARICGFNPLLLFAPDPRRRVWQIINDLANGITVNNSIFRALRKCPKCGSENRNPTVTHCSQCGANL